MEFGTTGMQWCTDKTEDWINIYNETVADAVVKGNNTRG